MDVQVQLDQVGSDSSREVSEAEQGLGSARMQWFCPDPSMLGASLETGYNEFTHRGPSIQLVPIESEAIPKAFLHYRYL